MARIQPSDPAPTISVPQFSGLPGNQLQRPIYVVAARFNEAVTARLVDGVVRAAKDHGIAPEPKIVWVAGALEIPGVVAALVRHAAENSSLRPAIVAIGCVIRGDTDHYHHVCTEAVGGVQELSNLGVAGIGNAILTVSNAEQAFERAGDGVDNKGYEAAVAALEVCDLLDQIDAKSIVG